MLLLPGIVIVDLLTIFVACEYTAIVDTSFGPVQCEIVNSDVNSVKYAAFKGIRYAKAPVEYLRFKPPVAVDPWTEILNAVVEGDDCPQIDSTTEAVRGSEDCLFINVYTPVTDLIETPKSLKSVMVWIHGGAFTTGTSSSRDFSPEYLLKNDIVYVSMNYRLGPLGFLSLNHPDATGNARLKDQILGLKWVQANIAKFGGNPKNVTIFGQSAGSACVGYHVLSDASVGLFHGAIGMSGVPLNPRSHVTPAKAMANTIKLGALLGTTSNDKNTLIEAFNNATFVELVEAASKISAIFPPFSPTVEDESITTDAFLSKCSIVKYLMGNFTKVPQIIGFMDQEAIYFVNYLQPIAEIIANSPDLIEEFGMTVPDYLIAEVKDLLTDLSTNSSGKLNDTANVAIGNITSDLIFITQIDQTQRLLAVNNDDKPIYYYHNSFYTNRSLHNIREPNNTLQGAAHADDLAYIFYYPAGNYSNDPTDPVARTIYRESTMWTIFAKYGNPTPEWIDNNSLNITWPNSGLSGHSLDIGYELTIGPKPINRDTKRIQLYSWPLLGLTNGCTCEKR